MKAQQVITTATLVLSFGALSPTFVPFANPKGKSENEWHQTTNQRRFMRHLNLQFNLFQTFPFICKLFRRH